MRTLALGCVGLAVVVAAFVLLARGGDDTFRVDAEFDTASGMVAGQNVTVAGQKVGKVKAVQLVHARTGGYRARMELAVASRYKPFRSDARCRILPQGIISENYVDCDPGSSAHPLTSGSGGVPTVAVARTAVPLSLQSVLKSLAAPAPDRLRLLINALGMGTAGRGADMNAILERANPALDQTRRLLTIINRQRNGLANAVTQTDRILGRIGDGSENVRRFVDRSAHVLDTTAAHRNELGQMVGRLPPLLTALERASAPIGVATRAGVPLLDNLRRAAPGLAKVNSAVPPFTAAATPGVRALGSALAEGRTTLKPLAPVAKHLREFTDEAAPVLPRLDKTLVSTRDKGGFEGLLGFTYKNSLLGSAYDSTSHFLYALVDANPACILQNFLPKTPVAPGCSHAYSQPGFGQIPPSNVGTVKASPATSRRHLSALLDYLLK